MINNKNLCVRQMIPGLFNKRVITPLRNISTVRKAGCIIIGDEILNAKIEDTNSRFFAKFCYDNGIELSKIAIVGDKENDIIETVQEFNEKFDLVVTSGGIGSTHDDITYDSIANSFGYELRLDNTAFDKYKRLRGEERLKQFDGCQLKAFMRMFHLPYHPTQVKTFYADNTWTPIVNINNKLNLLPGVPRFFEILLTNGLTPHLHLPKVGYLTYYVTTKKSEIQFAPLISKKQGLINHKNLQIKIGSYPHFEKGLNTISITGKSNEKEYIRSLVNELAKSVDGKEISKEEEFKLSSDRIMR